MIELQVREEHIRKAIESYNPASEDGRERDICRRCVLYYAAAERFGYLKRAISVGLHYVTLLRRDGHTKFFKFNDAGRQVINTHHTDWHKLINQAPFTVELEEVKD